jgi:hypothetical protein
MTKRIFYLKTASAFVALAVLRAQAQIDPEPRQLLHLGLNQSLHDDGPGAAYAFFYWNMPNVPSTNQTLRLTIAPVYLDSELAFKALLGDNTDLGVGLFGGAFANRYEEVRQGVYLRDESFDGASKQWNVTIGAATAWVDYVDALEQPGNWHSGFNGGIGYTAKERRWRVFTAYGYGLDAIRSNGRGGHNVALIFQYNFGHTTFASDRAFEALIGARAPARGALRR